MSGAFALLLAEPAFGLPLPWESLLGRLHPSLVHFPLALLLVAFLLEGWQALRGRPVAAAAAVPCAVLGALGALAASASGWLLATHDDPGRAVEDLLLWHRWLGVALAGLSALAALCLLAGRGGARPRALLVARILLCLLAPLSAVTGHLGGSMVHGREYLTGPLRVALGMEEATSAQPAPAPLPDSAPESAPDAAAGGPAAPASEVSPPAGVDFARDIRPILEARCVECHGAQKAKGDLRLDAPGPGGVLPPSIVASDPGASELIRRVELPADDLDVMPAKGDPLSVQQVALLRAWIAEGARWDG